MPSRNIGLRGLAALLWMSALFAGGCGASPTQPTSVTVSNTQAPQAAVTSPTAGSVTASTAATLSPAALMARGWTCRRVPEGTGCGHPNEVFPSESTPPEDRAPTVTILVFDPAGAFIGQAALLRADLYHGQPCESTTAPYRFFPLIGYYYCVRTTGS